MMNELLRPSAAYPIYPPYHKGLYLEEFFFQWIKSREKETSRQYIDVFWTNLYCNRVAGFPVKVDVQKEIDSLDRSARYFTVCQHDDGPRERLPPDTVVFSAGGKSSSGKAVPVPLVCSLIDDANAGLKKDIFCSFVGSITHPIRRRLVDTWAGDSDFFIESANWSPIVSAKRLGLFRSVTERSRFALCPRGYGLTSFRLYEAMQMGAVPVYISDQHHLPWSDDLDWSEFCILMDEGQIGRLKDVLSSVSDARAEEMVAKGRDIYDEYFSLEGVCRNILKRLA